MVGILLSCDLILFLYMFTHMNSNTYFVSFYGLGKWFATCCFTIVFETEPRRPRSF